MGFLVKELKGIEYQINSVLLSMSLLLFLEVYLREGKGERETERQR